MDRTAALAERPADQPDGDEAATEVFLSEPPDEPDDPDEPEEDFELPESLLEEPVDELSFDFSELPDPSEDEPLEPFAPAATVLEPLRLSVR